MEIPKTMRALVARGQGDYSLETIPVPSIGRMKSCCVWKYAASAQVI